MGWLSHLRKLLGFQTSDNAGLGPSAGDRQRVQRQLAELREQSASPPAKRTGGFRPSLPERPATSARKVPAAKPAQPARPAAPPRPTVTRPDDSIELPSPTAHLSATRAKLMAAFNASQPVNDLQELSGRAKELDKLLDLVVERGTHALIHGPRGSGKTSLARIFGDLAGEAGVVTRYDSASGDTDFTSLMRPFLADLPQPMRDQVVDKVAGLGADFGPRDLATVYGAIAGGRLLLIIDEFDRIRSPATNDSIAALIKLLSDLRLPVQLVLVGIAGNVDDLLAAHPSLRRHLISVAVNPISNPAVLALINEGSTRAGISFSEEARTLIVEYALGSPYHARLYCLNSGVAALKEGDRVIGIHAARVGLREAFTDWAAMNEQAAALIAQLASVADRDIGEAAKAAAVLGARTPFFVTEQLADMLAGHPGLCGEPRAVAEAVVTMLQPMLIRDEAQGCYSFADSLAPHFMLLGLSARR